MKHSHFDKHISFFSLIIGIAVFLFLSPEMIHAYAATDGTATNDEYINVSQYGVSGTDKASDEQALQRVMDLAKTNQGATLKVYIPSGTYYFEHGVKVYSNTEIKMDPDTILIQRDGVELGIFRCRSVEESELTKLAGTYEKTKNVTIIGGVFKGNLVKTKACGFIYFDHCSNMVLKDCTFMDPYSRHAVTFDGVDGLNATGLKFINCIRNDKIGDETNRTSEAFHIDHVSTDGVSAEGSTPDNDGLASKNVCIENCSFDGVNSGVGCHYVTGTSQGSNFTVRNCSFKNVKFVPIDVASYDNINITGNTAEKGISMLVIKRSNGTVSNNTIDKVAPYGDIKDSYGIVVLGCDTNTERKPLIIQKNTIKDSGDVGIQATKSKWIVISGNRITSSSRNGIYTSEIKHLEIKDNRIKTHNQAGIQSNGGDQVLISGNYVHGSTQLGIYTTSVKNLVISDNQIESLSKNGVGISIKLCSGYSENNTTKKVFRDANCAETFTAKEMNGLEYENKQYYYYKNGVRISGWKTISGSGTYYFLPSTKAATVGFKKIGGDLYYFRANGIRAENMGFNDPNNKKKRYIATADGVIPVSTVFTFKGKIYYAGKKGNLQKGWISTGKKTYYFSDSYVASIGFKKIDKNRYYFNKKGVMGKGWIRVDSKIYRANKNGKIFRNLLFTVKGKYYYATPYGSLKSGWKKVGNKKYYFLEGTGEAATGFKTIKGAKYYFNAKGVMQTKFFKVKKKTYYADANGHIVRNTQFSVGSAQYKADANGVVTPVK